MKKMLGDRMEKDIADGRTAVAPCTLTTSEYREYVNMESVAKVNDLKDSSMSSYTVSKKNLDANRSFRVRPRPKRR